MKVLLESPSGKKVTFSPKTAEYMIKQGWKDAEKSKPKTKPTEADK